MTEPQRFTQLSVSLPYALSANALYRNAFMIHYESESLAASDIASEADAPETSGEESPTLEDTARKEREYLRERLRDELKREPSEEELNEWLRRHTEGY